MIYGQLFLTFLQVGFLSVGGGYAAVPIIQNLVVEQYGWLTLQEFTNLIAIAEMTPGPIAVNSATFVGLRLAGIGGALLSTFGCVLPSLITVSFLAWLYVRYHQADGIQTVLGSLRPAVVALIATAAVNMFATVAFAAEQVTLDNVNWLGVALSLGAFIALRKFRWKPIPVMLGCGAAALLISMLTGSIA